MNISVRMRKFHWCLREARATTLTMPKCQPLTTPVLIKQLFWPLILRHATFWDHYEFKFYFSYSSKIRSTFFHISYAVLISIDLSDFSAKIWIFFCEFVILLIEYLGMIRVILWDTFSSMIFVFFTVIPPLLEIPVE